MNLRQNESKRIVHAPAKLNLFLDVLDRRSDGYHDLATLMVPIRLFDSLSFEATPPKDHGRPVDRLFAASAATRPHDVPGDSQQSGRPSARVAAAAERLRIGREGRAGQADSQRPPDWAADRAMRRRHCALPIEAGGIHWEAEQLAAAGRRIGQRRAVLPRAWGRDLPWSGERVERLRREPCRSTSSSLKPPMALATADVYRTLDELPADDSPPASDAEHRLAALAAALRRGNFSQLGVWMDNRLQAAAAILSTWIDRVQVGIRRARLSRPSAVGQRIGLFRHLSPRTARAAAGRGPQIAATWVSSSSPAVAADK